MNHHRRPVDLAMAENRPEKGVVRQLWVKKVMTAAEGISPGDEPLYLTLPGAEGRDIQLLIEAGLLSTTEVHTIAEEDQWKVVAVESDNEAVAALQRKYIGLRIKQQGFKSLVRGDELFSWPEKQDERYCRARVVNLDLNGCLKAYADEGSVVFPVVAWIEKLCRIHAKPPRTDWTLCLTLNGGISWSDEIWRYTSTFLCENLRREPVFDEQCKRFFGEELYKLATKAKCLDFRQLEPTDQQKLVMVVVPKLITRQVHNVGWRIHTQRNLRYGGETEAPMVTWIIDFTWDEEGSAQPDSVYREALREIFAGIGIVTKDGTIIQ
jgi:hypothetical protein